MEDIINSPADKDTGGAGLLFGGIVLVVMAMLVIFFGFSTMNDMSQRSAPESQMQQVPSKEVGDRSIIQVPDQIDVNVNQDGE